MKPHLVPGPSSPIPAAASAPPLLERFRMAARARGDAQATADTLVSWAREFILFQNKRHPSGKKRGRTSFPLQSTEALGPTIRSSCWFPFCHADHVVSLGT
jgi:hypothetical protein